jgi:hypothetical protein
MDCPGAEGRQRAPAAVNDPTTWFQPRMVGIKASATALLPTDRARSARLRIGICLEPRNAVEDEAVARAASLAAGPTRAFVLGAACCGNH